jgi:hypothetical protein
MAFAEDAFWHDGRSPAYGSGITFWALGEMIRARAQLNETDDQATTRTKLAESVARFVPDAADRARVESALGTLLGVADSRRDSSGELFGAWRLFFERMAAESLVVLVFEDLHWADPGQLDFIDHSAGVEPNVPILILTLARPELLDKRPDWGRRPPQLPGARPRAPRRRVDARAPRRVRAGPVRRGGPLDCRPGGGMPLYAVETIRMLVADGRLEQRPEGGFAPVRRARRARGPRHAPRPHRSPARRPRAR